VAALLGDVTLAGAADDLSRPNIVLVMADDMGWGQTGYYGHPVLKTPHLDAMAAHGLRFDRFYAGAPVCSPSRASVLTGRSNDRTGVRDHGYALRRQETTLPQALRSAGYATGHFGKWHLNGVRGRGVPVLASDAHHPGVFGFDIWLSATNYFDRNPILGRANGLADFTGDSSEVIVAEALKFIERIRDAGKPSFTVIWYGSPHHPASAADADKADFGSLDRTSQNHYGELVALDRSIGTLRRRLRELGMARNTLVWFCSDNGGLKDIEPETVGGLRDFKGSLYEGGLRVPAIIEWPAGIRTPHVTRHPAVTMDIFPTIARITRLPASAMLKPIDGVSLKPLFTAEATQRDKPIPFRYMGGAALIDNRYKLVSRMLAKTKFGEFELYDLTSDPHETRDIATEQPDIYRRMRAAMRQWDESVAASVDGKDYVEGRVDPDDLTRPRSWTAVPEYKPHLGWLLLRPEYRRTAEKLRQP
jgi:arylsulfatase A-like enzyme